MDNLLSRVLDAHGGQKSWARATKVTARLSVGGPFWAARGWPDIYRDVTVTLDPHRQHIEFAPFIEPGHASMLDVDPERITVVSRQGAIIDERNEPRASFPAFNNDIKWDAIQVAYFTSAAVWGYLTVPFLLARADVGVNEIDPWREDGQTWRRLAVRFSPTLAAHNADQIFYFDEAFMLRRLDYSPDVTGNPPIAHYTHHPKTFDGFVFPTHRRVHRRDARGVANQQAAAITIDVQAIAVTRA